MTPHCPRHFHIWPNLGGQSFHSLRGAVQRRSSSSNHCATWPDGESAGHMAERWSYGRTGLIWKNPGTALLFFGWSIHLFLADVLWAKPRAAAVTKAAELTSQEMGCSWPWFTATENPGIPRFGIGDFRYFHIFSWTISTKIVVNQQLWRRLAALCCAVITWRWFAGGFGQGSKRGWNNWNIVEGHKVKWLNGRRVSHSLLGIEHGCPNLELVAVCFWLAGWARNTSWTFARLSIYNEQLAACQHLKCSRRPQVLVKNRCLPCISWGWCNCGAGSRHLSSRLSLVFLVVMQSDTTHLLSRSVAAGSKCCCAYGSRVVMPPRQDPRKAL